MDCDGERYLCEDLVGASVIEHRLADYQVDKICYRIVKTSEVHACMELNITKRTCNIYYRRDAGFATRTHEKNHCRGWGHTHTTTFRGRIRYDWSPMPEVIVDLNGSQAPPATSARMSFSWLGIGARSGWFGDQKLPSPSGHGSEKAQFLLFSCSPVGVSKRF